VDDLVADGVHGLLVAPRDPAGLATAARRLLRDPQAAAGLGETARRRVLERYTLGRIAADVDRLYRRVLREGR
jgi:glycosyltransferase involved in cell wall biosynthesis